VLVSFKLSSSYPSKLFAAIICHHLAPSGLVEEIILTKIGKDLHVLIANPDNRKKSPTDVGESYSC
jgi:hypothetical protein